LLVDYAPAGINRRPVEIAQTDATSVLSRKTRAYYEAIRLPDKQFWFCAGQRRSVLPNLLRSDKMLLSQELHFESLFFVRGFCAPTGRYRTPESQKQSVVLSPSPKRIVVQCISFDGRTRRAGGSFAACMYRKPKPGRSDGEVHQVSRVN
jgi:hypothetical protein